MSDFKEELNSVTSDCSFVILGNESPSPGIDDSENMDKDESFHKILLESSAESLKSVENAFSSLNIRSITDQENTSDVQQRLDQLVKDNMLLKETLNQSNITMKNQFSALSMWHDEVMKTYESHKQKFMESQEQILKLELENANLKKMVGDFIANNARNGSYSVAMKNLDDDDIGALNKKHDSVEDKCRTANENIEGMQKKLGDLMKEKSLLEKKYYKLLAEHEQMEKDDQTRNIKCCKCQSSLDSGKGNKDSPPSYVEGVFTKFSDLSVSPDVENLIEEVRKLKRDLQEQQGISQNTSVELKKMKTEYDELLKEKEELQNALTVCKGVIEQFREQVKGLTAQAKINEEALHSKTQELQLVKKEMEKLALDCKEVDILRAQVELYQNDFNEERMAREKAVGAREEMAQELRLLKRMLEKERIQEEAKPEGFTSPCQLEEIPVTVETVFHIRNREEKMTAVIKTFCSVSVNEIMSSLIS